MTNRRRNIANFCTNSLDDVFVADRFQRMSVYLTSVLRTR